MKTKYGKLRREAKLFINFLKQEGVSRRFAANLSSYEIKVSTWKIQNYLDNYGKIDNANTFLTAAFVFAGTIQDHCFWMDLSDKWQKELEKANKIWELK